jgi:glycosyltransferase involved in cell wall biosynthesis
VSSLAQTCGPASDSRNLWLLDHAPILGGAERFALRLVRHAELRGGYTVRVVCPSGSRLAERCRALGIETIDGDFPELTPWRLLRQLPALAHTRKLLIEAGAHGVVVANTSRTQAYAVAAATTIRRPPPIVHIAHEQDTARRLTARFALRRQGALIAVGANAAAAYRLAMPAVEVGQVNNFLTPEEMTRLRDEVRPAHTGVSLGLIARMIPEKGIVELLAELAAAKAGWATLLVAASSEDPAYEAQVQARVGALGLGQRVVLMGHLDDVSKLLYAVDVVVVPSTGSEGQPTVILEALAAGRAVVLRRPLYSRDYDGLPVFAYTDASDLPVALDRAAGSSPASMTELRERFGPAQALAALERAALRATSGGPL